MAIEGAEDTLGIGNLLGDVDELGGIGEDTTFEADRLMFDKPVPGQGLVEEPGARAWEKPPAQSDPNAVLDMLFTGMHEPETATQLLRILDTGVPISMLIEPILMAGAMEGKYSVDVATAIAPSFMVILWIILRKWKLQQI